MLGVERWTENGQSRSSMIESMIEYGGSGPVEVGFGSMWGLVRCERADSEPRHFPLAPRKKCN